MRIVLNIDDEKLKKLKRLKEVLGTKAGLVKIIEAMIDIYIEALS